jgi:hypothetical protein
MGRSRPIIRACVLGLVVATGALMPIAPARAVSPVPITCTASGTLEVVTGLEHTNWKLAGAGSCQGDLEGTYILPNLLVQGTSDSMGLCGDDGIVTNLSMAAKGTLINVGNPMLSKTLAGQTWGSPITTYPVTTPFVIRGPAGNDLGAGTITSRIFGKCPLAGGSPVMTLQFTFLS